jgi:hypothetical protein
MFGIYNSFERRFVILGVRTYTAVSKYRALRPRLNLRCLSLWYLCCVCFIPSFLRTLIVVTRFRGSCNLVNRSIVLVAHIWKLSLFSL